MKLSFKTGGIIKQIYVREGESVERGKVLALLDLSEVKAQVNQARIGYNKSERDLRRAKNLYRDSVATLEQYEDARSAFELAQAQKQIAEFNLLHSRIKAPSDGKIQKILVEANEMIAPGHPALLFASTENDWVVRSALIDKEIVRISLGDSGVVTMDAFPGSVFKAEVTELGTVADPVTGTYEAELLILESKPQFRTGFFSRVQIYPTHINRLLMVPVEALLDATDKSASLFVYEQGKAIKRRITTGPIVDERIAVLKGVEEGELVITEGAKYVRDDSEVILMDQTESRNP
jgi:RND family efflux transporter MFP subunit